MTSKNKILSSALVVSTLLFFSAASQASDMNKQPAKSYWDSLKSESYKTYPDGWFYTLSQMAELYEVEYYEGNRLTNFIKRRAGNFIAECDGETFVVPELFIETTLRLLTELLDKGLAKYLFRLDSFHSHPFVTDQKFQQEYKGLSYIKMTEKYVHDPSLGALFHNAEHLALRSPPHTGAIDPEAQELISKRNVIGWYDGRELEIIYPGKEDSVGRGKSNTALIPEGFRGVGSIVYQATQNGEFSIRHDNKEIYLDISLFECYYH